MNGSRYRDRSPALSVHGERVAEPHQVSLPMRRKVRSWLEEHDPGLLPPGYRGLSFSQRLELEGYSDKTSSSTSDTVDNTEIGQLHKNGPGSFHREFSIATRSSLVDTYDRERVPCLDARPLRVADPGNTQGVIANSLPMITSRTTTSHVVSHENRETATPQLAGQELQPPRSEIKSERRNTSQHPHAQIELLKKEKTRRERANTDGAYGTPLYAWRSEWKKM